MVVDRAQEALAIGFEFLRPDAGELAQRGECGGPRSSDGHGGGAEAHRELAVGVVPVTAPMAPTTT